MFFRMLTAEEEGKFRAYARDNYKAGNPIDGCWHPTTQDECRRINRERAVFVVDAADDEEPGR